MSEIKSFSDYTSKYNSNVDYSALFGGTSDSSSVGNTNMLSDYAAIKNGSYGKLMKAYYAKQDAEKLSGKHVKILEHSYPAFVGKSGIVFRSLCCRVFF